MPNPHFNISITKRSRGQSAVAGAAYQSDDKLFSEYDQKYKDYSRKQGIVYTEIMLPSNAPPEFADRETLWNAAEEIEKQWNSQLARRFVLALPLAAINEELQPMKDIRRWVGKVISSEQAEIESKSEPKHSIAEKMRYYQDKEKEETQGKTKAMEQDAL